MMALFIAIIFILVLAAIFGGILISKALWLILIVALLVALIASYTR